MLLDSDYGSCGLLWSHVHACGMHVCLGIIPGVGNLMRWSRPKGNPYYKIQDVGLGIISHFGPLKYKSSETGYEISSGNFVFHSHFVFEENIYRVYYTYIGTTLNLEGFPLMDTWESLFLLRFFPCLAFILFTQGIHRKRSNRST